MTSGELNRTIEFIIQQNARVDRHLDGLKRAQKRDREWAKRLLAADEARVQEHAARIEEHAARLKWWEDFMREEREWRRGLGRCYAKAGSGSAEAPRRVPRPPRPYYRQAARS